MLRRVKLRPIVAVWTLVVVAAVSGCGSSEQTGTADTAAESTAETAAEPSAETGATGESEAAPDDAGGVVRYLSLGDSLTQGVGAADESTGAFPALLAELWRGEGCEVELNNVGISGYTTAQILDEQVPVINEFAPTFITFQAGGNDLAYGVTPDEYRTNVGAILDAATGSGAQVAVLAINEFLRSPSGQGYATTEQRDELDAILIEEAGARGAEFVDLRPLYVAQADAEMWVEDGLHPTEEAYQQWADELAAVIPAPCNS